MKNSGVFLYFRITGNRLNLDEISSFFSIVPETMYKKGEKNTTRLGEVTYTEDCWMVEKELRPEDDLNESLSHFLNRFKHFSKEHALFRSAKTELCIVLYPDDRYLNIDLSTDVIKEIGQLGIEISISVSSLFDIYNGDLHDK